MNAVSSKGRVSLKQSKSLEKKLARKMADLDAVMESRQQIDVKIKELQEEIENLQSAQLEQVFQQVKKSILKEGLRVDAEAVPSILQSIRDSQETGALPEKESAENQDETKTSTQDTSAHSYEEGYLPQEEENEPDMPVYNGSRLP